MPATADGETHTGHQLTLDRLLDAPRDKLWRCWTEPELLNQWFCPKPWFVSESRIDPRPGGEFYSLMNGPNGDQVPNHGVFLEVVPGEKLVTTDAFTKGWIPSGKPFMVATVEMRDEDGKTRYVATARHWTAEDKETHEKMGFHEGWGKAADQLEALAKTL